mmetsp:Transcript_14146/g.29748  ORF Transcript_14146/g.29748 Transcript_14146/m.29748 type:complete len:583 (+) Transcript_14146:480-2228(+)
MQTWEYAPQYALRTYAYLVPMAATAKFFQVLLDLLPQTLVKQLYAILSLQNTHTSSLSPSSDVYTLLLGSSDKPLLFAILRSFLAFISCYSELSFLSSIYDIISPTLAHWTALCNATAAGNFHASQAYLPSSTVMILWRLSAANQLRGKDTISIFWGLVAVLAVGWPFCAVLFISTGFWALWKAGFSTPFDKHTTSSNEPKGQSWIAQVVRVVIRTIFYTIAIQSTIMAVDFYHYGKIVSPVWNIFAYNAQSGGDELYGVEPLSYYIKNLTLNFNLVAMLAILALPLIMLRILAERPVTLAKETASSHNSDSLKILLLVPMYVWIGIVFPRSHKEERFLFPIYPVLCFGASITIDEIFDAFDGLVRKNMTKIRSKTSKLLTGLVLLSPSAVISISRSFALYHHYSAPLAIYQRLYSDISTRLNLSNNESTVLVCTAGEWYRFPSSFYLPSNAQLGFLKSSFSGQLPQAFTEFGSTNQSVKVQKGKFNDVNKEEMDRYVDIQQCSYVVELVPSSNADSNDIPECLQYMNSDSSGQWHLVDSLNYIDVDATPALHRILYIPIASEGRVVHKKYSLYARSSSWDE